jgi:diguanylate cyclase (GGDEF)-like protein
MLARDHRATLRFFGALGLLLVAIGMSVMLAVSGLGSVNRANEQVFADNFRTAEDTNAVATHLARVETVSLELLDAHGSRQLETLRADLSRGIVPSTSATIAALVRVHADDSLSELAQIHRIPTAWAGVEALARKAPLAPGSASVTDGAQRTATVDRIENRLDPLIAFVAARQAIEETAAEGAHRSAEQTYRSHRTGLLIAAVVAALCAVALMRSGLVLRRLQLDQARAREHDESAREYTDTLQATENEGEAQELLRRQIERTHAQTRAIVLGSNNSADRLEPRTSLTALPELREALEHAAPRSCLAVRFAQGHVENGDRAALTSCEVCGRLAGASTCEPLLVGGQVIGSVLVSHPSAPKARAAARIRETVAQAAPVLGNLRNLAIAELRAATDRLTGLPNQRAVQDTLKRMVAQASRTITPLTAVLFDLDHFKEVNDIYGHDRGDEVLAAVGVALRNAVRESDFVGRYGGEEFLLLLPSTGAEDAVQVAEAVRAAISAIHISGIDRRITASAGVATLPRDAGDPVSLFRAADRALYAAKAAGRDQVQRAERERAAGTPLDGGPVEDALKATARR